MKWLLLAAIVFATVASDLLQSFEMKRQGAVEDFHPGALGRLFSAVLRKKLIILAIICMAISFFSLLQLLAIAPLSFTVPASAATIAVETILARIVLREQVAWQRWAGATLVAGGVLLLAL